MGARSRLISQRSRAPLSGAVRLGIPIAGLGERLNQMHAWLDQNAGADGWVMTPSGARGVVNDAVAIYLADATIASAFLARWCAGHKAEAADGLFRVREDEPAPQLSPQGAAVSWGPRLNPAVP